MNDQAITTHTFCVPVVRETWRHGGHGNRGLLDAALLVRAQGPSIRSQDARA